MNEYFQSSLDLLLAELKQIELKLYLKVARMRQGNSQPEADGFRGLYISEKQVDGLINTPSFWREDGSSQPMNPDSEDLAESLRQLKEEIAKRRGESQRRGLILRLNELGRLFRLSVFDIDTILVCMLPELDLTYQQLYAYLQDDVTKRSPTVNLVLQLLCESFTDMLKARQAFSPEAPLLRYHLLHLYDEHSSRPGPLLAKFLQVDERIASYLLETDRIDTSLLPFSHLVYPKLRLPDVILTDDTKERLTRLVTQFKEKGLVCNFHGPDGVGRQATAEAVCSELGVPILNVDVNKMVAVNTSLELSLRLVFRESRLQNAALLLDGYDRLLGDEKEMRSSYESLITELENYPQWVFLVSEKEWQPGAILYGKSFTSVELPDPSYKARRQLWERQRNGDSAMAADIDFGDLAAKFRLSGGQIRDVVAAARSLARWRDPGKAVITAQDLYAACRRQFRGTLGALSRKIQPKYSWPDIILPKDQMEQLHEICSYVKYYYTVYDDWGFEHKLSTGKGLNVLFSGPSGTGKTMAAEIIANELGLDLYKIDLSAIVSKYIGETEKNLDRIFREGQTSNAILFFDEADALFGKRSEVRDSHDRYANIEVAYLLQKMDEYEGAVILATNMRKNMDEAFARRMHFTVEFPAPEEADRHRIWQNIFPREAPLATDIDLSFLARQFKITGGNIKNIALGAAFLAAQDGGSINMENIIWATKREFQKMGKLCTESDFARYFELVRG
ncbi:MAG TPA: ATP-binding protein [Dehalococcoidia bacterium]|nr:ATP-binding protein [Dehalococcoidia bacterium]